MSALRLTGDDQTKLRLLRKNGVSVKSLMGEFGISEATVQRYLNDSMRANSRATVRRPNRKSGSCYRCGMSIRDHAKCGACSILTHTGGGFCEQHSV